MGLLLNMQTAFYEPLKEFLYTKLSEKWVEDMIILYECVYFIQEEFLNAYFDEVGANNEFKINDKGQIQIKFNSSADFQKIFTSSMEA